MRDHGLDPPSARLVGVARLLLVVAAVAALLVLGTRLRSWSECWQWSITEGREGPAVYAIWRVAHGHPLYEWPGREPYSITLYNFGFYRAYGWLSALFGIDGERLLLFPRFFTLLGATLGAALHVVMAKRLAPPQSRLDLAALLGLVFVVWFGTQFTAWWAFAIRPDMWAAALALCGLFLALPALEQRSFVRMALASVVFWLAWTFKQSCVWTFAGMLAAVVLLARNARLLAALGAPFVVLAALPLVFGGEVYRLNLLTAPAASAWRLELFVEVVSRVALQNVWCFGFFAVAFALDARRGPRAAWSALSERERAVIIVAVVATVFGSAALGREGSNKNHVFEGYVASSLASWCALVRIAAGGIGRGALAAVTLLPLALFPLVQLVFPNRLGRTVLCTERDGAELAGLNRTVAALPKPLFTPDEVFSQPWHSSENRYPALVVDGTWYQIAMREGVVPPDFTSRLFRSSRFKSALLYAEDTGPDLARAAGATCEPVEGRALGMAFVACRFR